MKNKGSHAQKEEDIFITSPLGCFRIIGAIELEPVMQFGEDRHCKKCGTILSRYNPNEKCWPCLQK